MNVSAGNLNCTDKIESWSPNLVWINKLLPVSSAVSSFRNFVVIANNETSGWA